MWTFDWVNLGKTPFPPVFMVDDHEDEKHILELSILFTKHSFVVKHRFHSDVPNFFVITSRPFPAFQVVTLSPEAVSGWVSCLANDRSQLRVARF